MDEGSPLVGDTATVVAGGSWVGARVEAVRGLSVRLRLEGEAPDDGRVRFSVADDGVEGGRVHLEAAVLHHFDDDTGGVLAVSVERAFAPVARDALLAFLTRAFPGVTPPEDGVAAAANGTSVRFVPQAPPAPRRTPAPSLRIPWSRPSTSPASRPPTDPNAPITGRGAGAPVSRRFTGATEPLRVPFRLVTDAGATPAIAYRAATDGKVMFVCARGAEPSFGEHVTATVTLAGTDATLVLSVVGGLHVDVAPDVCAFVARVSPRTDLDHFAPWRQVMREAHRAFATRSPQELLVEEKLRGAPPPEVLASLTAG